MWKYLPLFLACTVYANGITASGFSGRGHEEYTPHPKVQEFRPVLCRMENSKGLVLFNEPCDFGVNLRDQPALFECRPAPRHSREDHFDDAYGKTGSAASGGGVRRQKRSLDNREAEMRAHHQRDHSHAGLDPIRSGRRESGFGRRQRRSVGDLEIGGRYRTRGPGFVPSHANPELIREEEHYEGQEGKPSGEPRKHFTIFTCQRRECDTDDQCLGESNCERGLCHVPMDYEIYMSACSIKSSEGDLIKNRSCPGPEECGHGPGRNITIEGTDLVAHMCRHKVRPDMALGRAGGQWAQRDYGSMHGDVADRGHPVTSQRSEQNFDHAELEQGGAVNSGHHHGLQITDSDPYGHQRGKMEAIGHPSQHVVDLRDNEERPGHQRYDFIDRHTGRNLEENRPKHVETFARQMGNERSAVDKHPEQRHGEYGGHPTINAGQSDGHSEESRVHNDAQNRMGLHHDAGRYGRPDHDRDTGRSDQHHLPTSDVGRQLKIPHDIHNENYGIMKEQGEKKEDERLLWEANTEGNDESLTSQLKASRYATLAERVRSMKKWNETPQFLQGPKKMDVDPQTLAAQVHLRTLLQEGQSMTHKEAVKQRDIRHVATERNIPNFGEMLGKLAGSQDLDHSTSKRRPVEVTGGQVSGSSALKTNSNPIPRPDAGKPRRMPNAMRVSLTPPRRSFGNLASGNSRTPTGSKRFANRAVAEAAVASYRSWSLRRSASRK